MPDLSTYEGRQAARDAAAAAGQHVVVDAGGVYNQTTGQTDTSGAAAGSGGGGGGPAAPAAAASPDLAGYVAAMQASSGLSIKQLDEQKREFDATLAQKKEELERQGLPQLAINKQLADLEDAKFAELQKAAVFSQNLQTAQQALDDRIKTGQLTNETAAQELANRIQSGQLAIAQDQQALARQIQTGQLAVSQGQLGLDTLKTAASLSGPENWIQAANFNRGVAGNSLLPGFVSQLLSGQSTATLGGPQPGAVQSAPVTLQGMAAQMGAAPGQPAPGVAATPTAVTQPAVPLTDPNADAAARAAAYTSAAANPTAAPPGFMTSLAGGQQVYTPSAAETAAAGAGAGAATAGMDPSHMGAFYAAALKTANGGTATPGVAPDPSASALPSDVAAMFGRTTANVPVAPAVDPTQGAQDALRKLYAGGGQALGPQQLEGLTPTETKMMQGGGAALGADVAGFQAQYDRSRIGQRTAAPATV